MVAPREVMPVLTGNYQSGYNIKQALLINLGYSPRDRLNWMLGCLVVNDLSLDGVLKDLERRGFVESEMVQFALDDDDSRITDNSVDYTWYKYRLTPLGQRYQNRYMFSQNNDGVFQLHARGIRAS